MKTELKEYTIENICDGFVYNEDYQRYRRKNLTKKKYYQENKIRLRRESLQRYYQKTKENKKYE